jgi:recombination protein RecT
MTQTIADATGKQVATRDNGPGALIKKYSGDFARVLPSHVKPDTWVRLAEGALKRGKLINAPREADPMHPFHGQFELAVAAANNPGVFLAALLDAARLGLEPGTEQYYLTPRRVGREKRLEILGIVGYQGYIELMYRAGAVASVVAEVVREHDEYRYQRGIDEVPMHRFPPFAREADRGQLIGTYAYARMKDGAVSRVIELNQDDIAWIKAVNPASSGEYSPWTNWEASMWLKSAARQLRKWVPTSAEFLREQARALAEANRVADGAGAPPPAAVSDDAIEGEVVEVPAPVSPMDTEEDWPETAQPAGGAE